MTLICKVHWANVAGHDLIGIIEYIAQDNLSNAVKTFAELKKKGSSLSQFPERGRIVPELKDHRIILYRELIVDPWRIIYRISSKTVYVLSVIDSRQNVEDILFQRDYYNNEPPSQLLLQTPKYVVLVNTNGSPFF